MPLAAQGEETLAPYDPRRLWRWLGRRPAPTKTLLGLLAFALGYRLLTLQMVASGGDCLRKWAWARVVLHGWSPSHALWGGWDHHAARLSINVPTLISQWLFGDDPSVYYVAPIACHLLTVALIFLLARRVVGLWLAAATGLAFVCLTSDLRAGQLMPEVFSPAYVLACVLCLTRATEGVRPGARVAWAAAAAACMMLAELSKVTNLFFVPGLLLGLCVRTRSLRLALVFCGVLGALLLVELLLYRELLGLPWGRASVIAGKHLVKSRVQVPIDGLWGLISRHVPTFRSAFGSALLLFLALAAVCLRRLGSLPGVLQLAVPATLTFALTLLFGVRSLSPLLPFEPPNARYFLPTEPFVYLFFAWLAARYLRVSLPGPIVRRPRASLALLLGLLLLRGAVVDGTGWKEHPLAQLPKFTALARAAYRDGLPIVAHSKQPYSMHAFNALFWDDFEGEHYAKAGYLPKLRSRRHRGKQVWYQVNPAFERFGSKSAGQAFQRWAGRPALEIRHGGWKLWLKQTTFR